MFLSSEEFMKRAKAKVYEMALASLCPTDDLSSFTINDVYIVTHAFILKNQKAMVSTTLKDGKYYEVTYNEAKSEMYVDQYVKVQNKTYKFPKLMGKTEPIKTDEVNVQPLYGCPIPPSNPRIYTGAESDEPGILQYHTTTPVVNEDCVRLGDFVTTPVVNEDCVSLDDFVNHVKHEHPDYFPADEKFVADERIWHDGVRRDIVKHALIIYGESSLALLMDANKQSLQDIKYFHVDVSSYAEKVYKISVGKVTHNGLLRHVVKTLYHMDWKPGDSYQSLWTEQIAEILNIPRDKVAYFITN